MIGERHHRWTIIAEAALYVAPNGRKNRRWLCRCDCGTEREVTQMRLRSGDSKSCGCFKSEKLSEIKRSHGHYAGEKYTPTMNSWRAMIIRCQPSHVHYKNYGGRGIKICERWRKFENFLADMGERPKGKTLDRIDNNKGYEPSNCRWATRLEQAHNKRNNRLVAYGGRSITIAEAAQITGIDRHNISLRLERGWSEHDALTRPVRLVTPY